VAFHVDSDVVDTALAWTYDQVRLLRRSADTFETRRQDVVPAELAKQDDPLGSRLSQETPA
jgi:hypothetical protein